MMTMTQQPDPFSELRGLIERATPGPWRFVKWSDGEEEALIQMHCGEGPNDWRWSGWTATRTEANAKLLCAAVSALPALLDERDRLIASMDKPAILAALKSFRFNDVGFDDDGSPMPLVDMLALEGERDIGNALQREDDLADHLYAELVLTARSALSQEIG